MKSISVLGSTGSIGVQALDVARWQGYRVDGLVAGHNWKRLLEQAREFEPAFVACAAEVTQNVRPHLPARTRLLSGAEGAAEIARLEVDSVVAAIPGMAGLAPTAAALAAGRNVALANKEAMIVAGPLMRQLADSAGAVIMPVDSEHSALYQSLRGEDPQEVAALVLTASGGPFREGPADLSAVTPREALAHPTWAMGPKVTVDSATLFNKGLEVLEAHFLFSVPLDRIEVVVHPQSLIHGLVRFRDGSLKAQIGPHDMRLPIQYGIEGGYRPQTPLEPLPLTGEWQFYPPDRSRFPCLDLAYRAGRAGGTAPAYLNAADEVAVAEFLEGRLRFDGIAKVIEGVLDRAPAGPLTWESISDADQHARELAQEVAHRLQGEAAL